MHSFYSLICFIQQTITIISILFRQTGAGVRFDEIGNIQRRVVEHGKTPAGVVFKPLLDCLYLGQDPDWCSIYEFSRHIVLCPDLTEFIHTQVPPGGGYDNLSPSGIDNLAKMLDAFWVKPVKSVPIISAVLENTLPREGLRGENAVKVKENYVFSWTHRSSWLCR